MKTAATDEGLLGRTVGHYKIERKLGEGGVGVVYEALDLRLNRPVALKFLHPSLAVENLEKEALAISALNHPNIATIYGIEAADDYRFIVLEYLPGGTLKSGIDESRAQGRQVPLDEALTYAIQIAEGLAHAHEHGIIHRDIKSSNILFTAQRTIKIADFSLASSDYHSDHTIAGTPACMSPEQAQGRDLDHRSDIFSFGIVLFELLTGKLPFRGATPAAMLQQIIAAPAPPLKQFLPDIPAALESIVCTALQKDREMRYQRMGLLVADLRSAQKKLGSHTQNVATLETATIAPATAGGKRTKRFGIVSLLLLAASFAIYQLPWLRYSSLPGEKRLAVLDFTNSGNSVELCDGLVDVISSKLTEMEQFQGSLLIISPIEVRKADVHTPSEARAVFGANLAITGTISRLEILVNLVDTGTLAQLRSFTIGAELADPVALEAGLVTKASQMLEISLRPSALLALQAGNTRLQSAYRDYLEGRGYLQRFDKAEQVDNAMAAFRKAIQLDSRYAEAHAGMAEAWLDRWSVAKDPQAVDEALKCASRAVELGSGRAEVRVTMGRAFSTKGWYEEAEREFQQALKIDPVNADAYRGLARAYEKMKRRKDAERTYQRAIQLRPIDWRGYQALGNYYFHNGKNEEATRYYQRVLKLTPGNYNAYSDLGAAYLRMGNYAEAETQLLKSVALRPVALNFSNLGSVYYLHANFREAVRWYEKAVAAVSTNSSWWGNLGDAYREIPELSWKSSEAYGKAISLGRRELAVDRRNSLVRSRLADYYAAMGDTASASREIAEALRLSPDEGYVLVRAVFVYEQLHRRDAAIDSLRAALRAGYSVEEIRQAPVLRDLRADSRYAALMGSK